MLQGDTLVMNPSHLRNQPHLPAGSPQYPAEIDIFVVCRHELLVESADVPHSAHTQPQRRARCEIDLPFNLPRSAHRLAAPQMIRKERGLAHNTPGVLHRGTIRIEQQCSRGPKRWIVCKRPHHRRAESWITLDVGIQDDRKIRIGRIEPGVRATCVTAILRQRDQLRLGIGQQFALRVIARCIIDDQDSGGPELLLPERLQTGRQIQPPVIVDDDRCPLR